MSDPIRISDPDDPRVVAYVDLADPDLRMRVEAGGGFFIAESPLVISNVARAGRRFRSVLVTPKQHAALAAVLDEMPCPVYVAEDAVLRRVVGFNLHRGAVAAVEREPLPDVAATLAAARRIAVLERVNDHENLGVLFRSAAAFGLDAVVLDRESSDPLYRRSVRVSIGHVCTVPWTRYDTLGDVTAAGLTLVAMTPAPSAMPIDEIEWPTRTALLIGAEGPGLSATALAAAALHARIPTRDAVDSLNVSTAASIAFYEAQRSLR